MSWPDAPRLPLEGARLRELIALEVSPCIEIVESTGSTNSDLLGRLDLKSGTLLVAEEQTQGRGRLDRSWSAPKGSAILLSLYREANAALPLAPLIMGVAAAQGLRAMTTVPVLLKWPNDLMVADRKLGGILAQQNLTGVVVGIGINISLTDGEKPDERATSLFMERDTAPAREEIIAAIVSAYLECEAVALADWSAFIARYQKLSATIGKRVRVTLVNGEEWIGEAMGISPSGALILRNEREEKVISSGDVFHLR